MHLARWLSLTVVLAQVVDGQTVQYRSPAGVEYRAQADTGAVARAERALGQEPSNVRRIIDLGLAHAGVRQYREAIAVFGRGLAIEPDNATLLRWRGHRYLSVREFDRAQADFERGLRIDSTNYGILYHLAIVKFVRGDFLAAAALFARAEPHAPDAGERAGSTDWRWMSLARAGRKAEAQQWLAQRADSVPVSNAYAQRLRLYRGQVRPEALITSADTADVQLATLHFGLGNWYLVQGDTASARRHFQQVIRSGGWPGFGFIVAEAELARLR